MIIPVSVGRQFIANGWVNRTDACNVHTPLRAGGNIYVLPYTDISRMSETPEDAQDEISAALLTKAQRAYLRGEKDYRPSVEREVRSRIRKRVYASFFDLALLAYNLPDEDYDRIMDDLGVHEPTGMMDTNQTLNIPHSMLRAISFPFRNHKTETDFESTIAFALREEFNRRGSAPDIEVTVNIKQPETIERDELERRLEAGDISQSEIGSLFRQGKVSFDDFVQLVRGRPMMEEGEQQPKEESNEERDEK